MMDGKLLAVQYDGSVEWVECSYEGIKEGMRGATIDLIAHHHLGCFVDDNGMIDREKLNWTAAMMMFQPLYGPVVFCAPDPDDEGNTLPTSDEVYAAIANMAGIVKQVRHVADTLGQDIDCYANPDTMPPPMIVGLSEDWSFGDPLPTERAPVCPACGAEGAWTGTVWETAHELDCTWMRDPESEPYP